MKRVSLIAVVAIFAATLAQGEGAVDETRIALRQEFLRLVNRDRTAFGLQPVTLDPFSSSVADNYCRAQIRNGTTGHFTVDGQAPYMRYSFAGGNDAVSENAAAWSANYRFTDRALYEMIRRSEDAMITELAPHDGHRKTILDPYANFVGIGLAWEKGEFRLTQEFIRHYIDWTHALPRTAASGERVVCSARPIHGYDIEAITVHHEPLPQTISPVTANIIDSYSLPDQRQEYLPRLTWRSGKRYSDGRRGDFPVADDGSFTFDIPLNDGAGIYTVVVWVHRRGDANAISASNVSIRVDAPASQHFEYSSR
jgi:uncharacterized protein YkwD